MIRNVYVLLIGLSLLACSDSGGTSDNMDSGSANELDDSRLGRRVSGVWLLSTDYNYEDRCNYLPEEFVRNMFQLGDKVELTKYSGLSNCELRWGSNRIGFYLESKKPFESIYQSEYYFNKLFQPQANPVTDQNTEQKPALSGPHPQGTGAEVPADMTPNSYEEDSTRGADPAAPRAGITSPGPPIVAPAQNTATGEAVNGVGDKAIWEPGKKSLHVLHNNHVFSVMAQMPGDQAKLKQGCILLAKRIVDSLNDRTD